MKIINTDNFDRDYVSDKLVAENVPEGYAKRIVKLLNESSDPDGPDYFKYVDDDYTLFKFQP